MEYVVNSAEMKRYDNNTSSVLGVPEIVLMERAAIEMYRDISLTYMDVLKRTKVLILCGVGNNGGDGIALSRLLRQAGIKAKTIIIGDYNKASELNKIQKNIHESYQFDLGFISPDRCLDIIQLFERDDDIGIIIDALFGIGISRELSETYSNLFECINQQDAIRIAVDIPSGVSADGLVLAKTPFDANITYTFGFKKLGHFLYPAADFCGDVKLLDMGIDEFSLCGDIPLIKMASSIRDFKWPSRNAGANKGTFGKLLIIAGSDSIAGAALLATSSAFACGIGMVSIVTHENNKHAFEQNFPEAMLKIYSDDTPKEELSKLMGKSLEWCDGILIGPGIGTSSMAEELLRIVINDTDKPLVMDADALNILAMQNELVCNITSQSSRRIILTPHLGEFSRLTCTSIGEIKKNIIACAKDYAIKTNCTIICKDATSVIVSHDSKIDYINTSGNNGMATAGSGDVLAGICGVLNIQMKDTHEAGAASAYIHGYAGSKASQKCGVRSMKASDIIDELIITWREIDK